MNCSAFSFFPLKVIAKRISVLCSPHIKFLKCVIEYIKTISIIAIFNRNFIPNEVWKVQDFSCLSVLKCALFLPRFLQGEPLFLKAHSKSCNDFHSLFTELAVPFALLYHSNQLYWDIVIVFAFPTFLISEYLRARALSYCLWILVPKSWA